MDGLTRYDEDEGAEEEDPNNVFKKKAKTNLGLSILKNQLQDKKQEGEFDRRMRETAKLQFIQKQKELEQNCNEIVDPNNKKLILTRFLGHKFDIPGSGRWKVFLDCHLNWNDCWHCDKHIYSVIFWNELIGNIQMAKYRPEDKQFIVE